ncbi:phosphoribosyltransferase family protein [Embleya scabrispora]|uniref:phosphoribosyltransferase family protein n=1 Tax=Embleya scabrispora TaxID=159449 RepID=UPI00036558D9|nr:phosphoribosyltransferase family protein [Embleya scabrispora]MYS84737.1 phosphoribosyltransferase [Streptomyces sp. SID5474]
MLFTDRVDAGQKLAERLAPLEGQDVIVLGLARGGVPVAAEVADALRAPLDVCLVRKLGVPFQPELGMGAVAEEGVIVLNDHVVQASGVSQAELAEIERRERELLERRARRYRGERPPLELGGRTVVVVDDGIATGSTARAACRAVRDRGAARVVLAVPVAPAGWGEGVDPDADEVVCLHKPVGFMAVGQFYADFSQTTDEEVVERLDRALARRSESSPEAQTRAEPGAGAGNGSTRSAGSVPTHTDIELPAGTVRLPGHLIVPAGAERIVVFAHGSGSSRHSPRNRFVATALNRAGLGTLLFDLLTESEGDARSNVFDIELLARRLIDVTHGLRERPETRGRAVDYFGASTGAAAALWAAAELGDDVGAVVSRGGRPDLAEGRLPAVTARTLLIVGGNDHVVLELNNRARTFLRCESRLEVVPGASHLFEEPGTLDAVADLARDWFLGRPTSGADGPAHGH